MARAERITMRGKSIFAFLLIVVMLAGDVLRVSAAGVKDIFDADFYAGKYNDLKSAYGNDEEALLKHFLTRGAGEGRVMSPVLDVVAYRAAYADLNAAFGDDWNAYVNHYFIYGIREKRTSGVLFDLAAYAGQNPHVRESCGDDYAAIARYYITENRTSDGIVKKAVVTVSKSLAGSGGRGTGAAETSDANTPDGENLTAENSDAENSIAESPKEESSAAGASVSEVPSVKESAVSNESASNVTSAGAFATEHIHVWAQVSSLEVTCVEDGYNEYCCQDLITYTDAAGNVVATLKCRETMREEIKAAHTRPQYVAYIVPSTCTQGSIVEYNCTVCGQAVSEEAAAPGHDYDENTDKPVRVKASTCTEAGRDVFLCKRCGAEITEERPLANHTVTEWVNDQEAACAAEGKRHGRCLACNTLIFENTEKAAHTNVQNRNVIEDAYQVSTSVRHLIQNITYCRDCGYIISASGPSYVNCADAGNGKCCTCNLAVTREALDAVKIYKAGDIYSRRQ